MFLHAAQSREPVQLRHQVIQPLLLAEELPGPEAALGTFIMSLLEPLLPYPAVDIPVQQDNVADSHRPEEKAVEIPQLPVASLLQSNPRRHRRQQQIHHVYFHESEHRPHQRRQNTKQGQDQDQQD